MRLQQNIDVMRKAELTVRGKGIRKGREEMTGEEGNVE